MRSLKIEAIGKRYRREIFERDPDVFTFNIKEDSKLFFGGRGRFRKWRW